MREAFQNYSDQSLTAFGLIIFVVFFTGVVLWVFRKSQKNYFDSMAQLPLSKD
jgi:cbb3-type cytochrome oxidase subunit 3